MVKKSLKQGNLLTALNIVNETGQGRRELREYQLKLANYSDMTLLTDFLEKSKLSVADILRILREE